MRYNQEENADFQRISSVSVRFDDSPGDDLNYLSMGSVVISKMSETMSNYFSTLRPTVSARNRPCHSSNAAIEPFLNGMKSFACNWLRTYF